MEINITIGGRFFANRNQLLYNSILSKWFYVPAGVTYNSLKPTFLPDVNGFTIKGRTIKNVISTCDLYEINTTNADALLIDFSFLVRKEKVKRIFQITDKPVILSVPHFFTSKRKLVKVVVDLENSGVSGLYTGPYFPVSELKKICSFCSVPVFSFSGTEIDEIKEKLNSGVFALCFSGKKISPSLIKIVRNMFPSVKIIALCGKSENLITKCNFAGIDAIIFKPCVPFDMDLENL